MSDKKTVLLVGESWPHWLPQTCVDWPGYATLWKNLLGWVTATS